VLSPRPGAGADALSPAPCPSRLRCLAWFPLLMLLGAMGVLSQVPSEAYDPPALLLSLNLVFSTLVSLFIAYLMARSFLVRSSPGLLMLGCGVILWGAAGTVGAAAGVLVGGSGPRFANILVTIHNNCVCLSALCHLAGVVLALRSQQSLRVPGLWLWAAYTGALGVVGLVTAATVVGWTPMFFVQGEGGTLLRSLVLGTAAALFLLTAVLLWTLGLRPRSAFSYWYAHALTLIAAGLCGVLLESSHGNALSWAGRAAQYMGGVFMLVAALASVRESRAWSLPLEKAFRESEERYRSLFTGMTEGFALHELMTDEAGAPVGYRFLDINPAFERLTGLHRAEVVGKPLHEVLPGEGSKWLQWYGQVIRTDRPVQFENDDPVRKQHYEGVAYRSGPMQFAVLFKDITQRKRAEETLKQLHGQLEQKVRERTEELAAANQILRMISECNEAFVRVADEYQLVREVCQIAVRTGVYRMAWVGYAENDADKTVTPVAAIGFEQGYLEHVKVTWADTERGRGPTGRCIRTDQVCIGRNFATDPELAPWREDAMKRGYHSSVALPLLAAGKAFGALTLYAERPEFFDTGQVTMLRELADDLAFGIIALRAQQERDRARQIAQRRAEQLQALAAELTQTEQRERQRLARVLHDHLQQLLVGAKFSASILRGKSKTKETQMVAAQLSDALDEAIRSARSLTAELSPPVLHEKGLAAGLEWLGRQMQEKHGLAVDVQIGADTEPDSEHLRAFLFEAVRELLFNVVKHAGVNRADVHLTRVDGRLRVSVSDEGVGFDPSRLEGRASRAGGFGLFSIRERLGFLGGSLEVRSAPGAGCCFTLLAPTSVAAAPAAVLGPEATTPSTPPQTGVLFAASSRIRVLLADDHHVMRQGLAVLLREQPDIEVVGEAANGLEAVSLTHQLRPDVVVMDVSMPQMGGVEATRRLTAELSETRILGLSMHEAADMASVMLEAGAVAYLTKGGPIEDLIAAIRACRRPQ
jgi:PAS domain S-box-containing protein